MPETTIENARIDLRAARKLRALESAEEGAPADRLPGGIYGFTYAPQEAAIPIFARHNWHSFEMHKPADGSVHLVGYVNAKDAGLVNSGEHVSVTLFPDPWEEATEFISVPMSRVVPSKKGPSREGGNGLPLELL